MTRFTRKTSLLANSLIEHDRSHLIDAVAGWRGHESTGARVFASAKDAVITDQEGRALLDAFAGLWCINAGYGQPSVNVAATLRMETLSYDTCCFDLSAEPTIRLADVAQRDVDHVFLNLGQLGRAVLDALRPLGFCLSRWSHSPKGIEGIKCHKDLESFCAEAEIVVCLLPLTQQTNQILNADFFDGLPKGAGLVQVRRGRHLDQAALLGALESGRISAAWLDVTDPEPLPCEHPLWQHPGVVITPHTACQTRAEDAALHIISAINAEENGTLTEGHVNRGQGY